MADKRRNLGIPSGVVFPFAGTTAPYGYLICDGSAISRSDYPALFVSLGSGTLHGVGDGSTTFNLPDYRGKFMRGLDGTAGNDPDKATRTHPVTGAVVGDVVGSEQSDAHQNITGDIDAVWRVGDTGGGTGAIRKKNTGASTAGAGPNTSCGFSFNASLSPGQRTSTETRPKNANVNYIVKV
jgi:microcystin-dependent protein